MKRSLICLIVVIALTSSTRLFAQGTPAKPGTLDIKKQVNLLYSRMTLEEKVAQLCAIRPEDILKDGKVSLEKCKEKIPNGIGHISQFACGQDKNPDELRDFVRELQNFLINETPSGIPGIFHEEAITGFAAKGATIYPQQLGVGCTWNPDLAKFKTEQTAHSMRAVGSTLALSPMVDVIRSAHWSRIEESYGEDGYLTSAMGVAFVEGLQMNDLTHGVAACSKHFLGYGGGSSLTWKEIYEEVLMPHEAIIRQAGSKVIMTSYGRFRHAQAVSNDTLLTKLLKKYLQFDGLVVSDYGAVAYSNHKGNPEIVKQHAIESIKAGNHLDFPSGGSYKYLTELIKEGRLSEKDIEKSVKRALTLKAQLGMLSKDRRLYAEGPLDLDKPEYRQTSYELACQSVVLLKNNGILPLTGRQKKVALVGPNANTYWSMLGDYTYQSMRAFWQGAKVDPNEPKIVSLYEGLQNKMDKEFDLSYQRGCDWSASDETSIIREGDPRTERLKLLLMESSDPTNRHDAIQLAAASDVIIAALGENPTLSGEARQRKGICLPGDQEAFLKELIATGKPVILVIFGGRPQVIEGVDSACAAILQAWYPGEEGGNAVTDILLGNVNPSGKLCVSYPRTENEESYCYNNGKEDHRISYPFGFGLSYTSFTYSDMCVPKTVKTNAEYIEVSCKIKNTGTREGTEIIQLYLSPKSSQPLKPIQLKGFNRVNLKPGETKDVTFNVSPQQLAYYMKDRWVIDNGVYEFKIGASSSDIRLNGACELIGNPVRMERKNVFLTQ